jgi:hypothetical protein
MAIDFQTRKIMRHAQECLPFRWLTRGVIPEGFTEEAELRKEND